MQLKRCSLLVICLSMILTGCWDRREINDIALVMGSAIDKEKNLYRTTVQVALPGQLGGTGSQSGGGGTSGSKSWYSLTATGATTRESNEIQQRALSRTLYFAHRRVLLLGEELSKSGVSPSLDVVSRVPQNRLSAYVAVTKGPARDVLNADTPIERFPSEAIREILASFMKRPRSLKHFIDLILAEGIDPAVPYLSVPTVNPSLQGQKEKKNIRVDGLAVFKKDKLIGFLSGEDVNGALWAMNEVNRPEIVVDAPGTKQKITLKFQETNTGLTPVIQGSNITMRIKFQAKGSIIENQSKFEVSTDAAIDKLESVVAAKIKADIKQTFKLLQTKMNADIAGFGKSIQARRPNEWRTIGKNWDEIYPTVKLQIEPNIHIEHTGTILTPLPKKERTPDHD